MYKNIWKKICDINYNAFVYVIFFFRFLNISDNNEINFAWNYFSKDEENENEKKNKNSFLNCTKNSFVFIVFVVVFVLFTPLCYWDFPEIRNITFHVHLRRESSVCPAVHFLLFFSCANFTINAVRIPVNVECVCEFNLIGFLLYQQAIVPNLYPPRIPASVIRPYNRQWLVFGSINNYIGIA